MVANYTYVDTPPELTGISKTSYNLTLYYETDRWGARGSLNHRTRWYSGRSDEVMNAGTRGFEGSTYVDAAVFYNITDKLQASLDAVNLTNQKDTQFWGQNQVPLQPDPERHDLHGRAGATSSDMSPRWQGARLHPEAGAFSVSPET